MFNPNDLVKLQAKIEAVNVDKPASLVLLHRLFDDLQVPLTQVLGLNNLGYTLLALIKSASLNEDLSLNVASTFRVESWLTNILSPLIDLFCNEDKALDQSFLSHLKLETLTAQLPDLTRILLSAAINQIIQVVIEEIQHEPEILGALRAEGSILSVKYSQVLLAIETIKRALIAEQLGSNKRLPEKINFQENYFQPPHLGTNLFSHTATQKPLAKSITDETPSEKSAAMIAVYRFVKR